MLRNGTGMTTPEFDRVLVHKRDTRNPVKTEKDCMKEFKPKT